MTAGGGTRLANLERDRGLLTEENLAKVKSLIAYVSQASTDLTRAGGVLVTGT